MNTQEQKALQLLRISGAVVFLLAAWMAVVMPQTPVHAGVDGLDGAVIGFELASTPDHVFGILGNSDDPQRPAVVAAMDLTNRIDFAFMLAYPALCFAIAALLVARGLAPLALAQAVAVLAALMFVGDFVENRQLLVLSHLSDPAAMLEPLGRLRTATTIKWAALFVTALAEGATVWRYAGPWRWSALLFAGGGIAGLLGAVWRPGLEQGANILAIAWLFTWIHSLRSRGAGLA